MIHDDAMLDDVASLALGVLPAAQAVAVSDHVRSCAECRATYADLRPVADSVGYVETLPLDVDELDERRRKNAIMSLVRADLAQRPAGVVRPRPRPAYLAWGAAVAAVLVAAVAISDDLGTRAARDADSKRIAADADAAATRVAALQSQLDAQAKSANDRVAAVLAAGGKHFDVPEGEVVTNGSTVTIAVKLPPPPAGKTYQAWTLAKGATAVAPSVLFVPDANGVAVVRLPQSAANLVAVAISVEPSGGSKAPTSTPKFVRKLS